MYIITTVVHIEETGRGTSMKCVVDFADTYMQKAKKSYLDSRARRNLGHLNNELHDVHRIMVQNITEVLQRGEALSGEWLLLCVSTLHESTN